MKKLLTGILLLTLFVGCQKDKFSNEKQIENLVTASQAINATVYSKGKISTELFNSYDWEKQVPLMRHDTVISVKVMHRGNTAEKLKYLLVHNTKNGWGDIVEHEISYTIKEGKSLPQSITSTSLLSKKTGTKKLQPEANKEKQGRNGIEKKSLVSPGGTLPMVTIVGTYQNGQNVPLSAAAYYFLSSGGLSYTAGNGSGVNYDPYQYLDYLDPLYTPDAGSPIPQTFNLVDYDVVANWFYQSTNYPGMNSGLNWRWWHNYDVELFTPNVDPDQFSHEFIQLCMFYEMGVVNNYFSPSLVNMEFNNFQAHFASYTAPAPPFPLIPIIMRIIYQYGINAGADFVMQLFMEYLMSEDFDLLDALVKIKYWQVAKSGLEGVYTPKGTSARIGKATVTGLTDVLISWKAKSSANEDYTLDEVLADFSVGFAGELAGGTLGDLAAKYPIDKIAKGLIKKFDFPYASVCKWMGKGVKTINKTFVHHIIKDGVSVPINITANKVMEGWAEGKIAVIGRSMKDRVLPFANMLAKELGTDVHVFGGFVEGATDEFNLAKNKEWIQSLKEQGYTIYDIGLDPKFGPPNGIFYQMELDEIFGN